VSRAAVALLLEVVFFALAFGWRSWVQWRHTGSTGFIRPRHGASAAELVGSSGFVLALVLLVAAPVADLAGMARIAVLDTSWAAAAGVAFGVGGVALTLVAQLAMGDSWRIGVDPAARTDLVTDGAFSSVRNPIFTAMIVATVGLVLLVPNPVSAAALLVLVAALEVQVRLVEEPYLSTIHGSAYDVYRSSAGRFVPGVGLGSATR
jgi:protein-S-isoprenylcysteine O-methyltransferase Ste14